MRNLKNFAVSMLVALICTVVFGVNFTSCTNSEDGMPTFTASVKKEIVTIEKTDTIWKYEYRIDTMWIEKPVIVRDTLIRIDSIPYYITIVERDTTVIYVDVIQKEGIKANGRPDLLYQDEETYKTYYPLIVDGTEKEVGTDLNVRASMASCNHNIIVVDNPVIGAPAFSAEKSTRQYQDGDFTKMEFKAAWTYNFGTFSETINTVHEKAWYYGWEMLSSYWTGGLKEIIYGQGSAYTYNGVEGTLYENTLVWEFTYNEDDVRTFERTHNFFVPNEEIPTDPEAVAVFGKNFTFETISDNAAVSSFELWQRLDNGTEEVIDRISATLSFRLENAQGVVVTLSKDEAFALTDGQAIAGTKRAVGSPRRIGNIEIQQYVVEYTTTTDKSQSVFRAYTEEATYVVSNGLGENIDFLSADFSFQDNGTTELSAMANDGNFERMHAFSQIVATYSDRNLNGEGEIILRRQIEEEEPEVPAKKLESVAEKSFDGINTYVITRYYDDGTYSDTTIVNTYGYEHSITMPTLDRLYRDNTNFGNPTITKNGNASKVGSSTTRGGLIFQTMSQVMTAAYNGHSHDITLRYTSLMYTEAGKSCTLSVPAWNLSHANTSLGSVRNETENDHNYEVTPVEFYYNAAFGNETAALHNCNTEVWNDLGEIQEPEEPEEPEDPKNIYGIASGSQSHTWDYNNAHHIATIFVYNIYNEEGELVDGGLKGFIDGKEVVKKSWSEVNDPAGNVASLAQKADGTWVFCRAYRSNNAFVWRSIEKSNNNTAITSIDVNQVQIAAHGTPEVYIASSFKVNTDGSVTVSSAEGSATAAAW